MQIEARLLERIRLVYPIDKIRFVYLIDKSWLHRHRRAERSYCTFKVRRGGHEEIPLIQGKRNPRKTVGVARGHQRADILKP